MASNNNPNVNMIVNTAYKAGTISLIMFGNSWVMKRFLKMNPANLSKLDFEDVGKLTLSVFSATWLRDYAVKNGWIPEDIITG